MNKPLPFSLFDGPISNVDPCGEITLTELYEKIIGDSSLKFKTERVRRHTLYKTGLPYVTSTGIFFRHADDQIISYSNIPTLDFDHLTDKYNFNLDDVKRLLAEDKVFNFSLVFTSPSETGLKAFFTINDAKAEEHDLYYTAALRYMEETYNLKADPSCRNISRACFLCHDPNPYFSEGSIDRETLLSFLPAPAPSPSPTLSAPRYTSTATACPAFGTAVYTAGERPSDKLNRLDVIHRMAVSALERNGWKFKGDLLTRPGKELKEGCSALYNIYDKYGIWILTCFTNNAFPFKAHNAYSDCQILCLLEYQNNWRECIADLSSRFL